MFMLPIPITNEFEEVNSIGWIDTVAGGGGSLDCVVMEVQPWVRACITLFRWLLILWGIFISPDVQFNNKIPERWIPTWDYYDIYQATAQFGPGFSGDGGPAAGAGVISSNWCHLDLAGNGDIADYETFWIRKSVDRTGLFRLSRGTGARHMPATEERRPPSLNSSFRRRFGCGTGNPLYRGSEQQPNPPKVGTNGNIINAVAGNGTCLVFWGRWSEHRMRP